MVNLSLEDIDNDIDTACIEVIANIMTNILVAGSVSPAHLDIEIILFDKIKAELQRISLVVHEFIESSTTSYKTDITTDEVIKGNIEGLAFVIPVRITTSINKKEPKKQVDWRSSSEEAAFAHMKDVLDNMDELLVQVDDEKARIVTDNIMEEVQESIQGIVKKVLIQGKHGFNDYDIREMAVKNILGRLNTNKDPHIRKTPSIEEMESLIAEVGPIVQVIDMPTDIMYGKKEEEPKLEEVSESQKVDPSALRYHVGSRWEPTVFSIEGVDVRSSMHEKFDGGEVQEKYVEVKAFVNDKTFIEFKSSEESPSLSLRQLIRKYQLELLQLEQLFPTLEIYRYLDVNPKITDMFFPLTKDVIDSKIDISMPHPLPSMIDAFIKELHDHGYVLIYKPNIPR